MGKIGTVIVLHGITRKLKSSILFVRNSNEELVYETIVASVLDVTFYRETHQAQRKAYKTVYFWNTQKFHLF